MGKDSSMQDYRESLETLSRENSSLVIFNSGERHAVVLYSVLLEASHKCVRIFCQSGNSKVWHDPIFTDAMEKFLRNEGADLKVLTAQEPALDRYWTDKPNVAAKQISSDKKERIYQHFRNHKCNFAVFDENKYRYEYDCSAFKAYGCFNNQEVASEFISLFNDAFEEKASENV